MGCLLSVGLYYNSFAVDIHDALHEYHESYTKSSLECCYCVRCDQEYCLPQTVDGSEGNRFRGWVWYCRFDCSHIANFRLRCWLGLLFGHDSIATKSEEGLEKRGGICQAIACNFSVKVII